MIYRLKSLLQKYLTLACVLASAAAGSTGYAQGNELVVVQVAPFIASPVAAEAFHNGAKLWFDHVNKQGGINGRKIKFVKYDDDQKKDKLIELVEQSAQNDKPVALLGTVSTGNNLALIKSGVLQKYNLPLVGPGPGASSLLGTREVFMVKADYAQEIRGAVRTIKTLGYRKVALLFQGDAFGTDVKAAFEKETAEQGVSVAGMQSFKPDVSDMNEAVAALMNLEADVIYLGTSGSSVMQFYEKYLAQPKRSRLVGMSVFDVDAVRQRFGKDIAGVGVSLVVPNPENNKLAISREFQQLAKNSNLNLTLRSMESFVAAKTITQGLRKTRGQPNSAALIKALRSEPKMDLGGYVLNLTDSNAAASSYIELAVLNAQGRLRQ